jgi:hypothetical protein
MAQRSSPSPVLTAREVSSRESLFNCVTAFQSSSYRFGSKANFSNLYRLIGVDTPIHHAVPTVPLGGVSHPVSFHLLSSAQASALSTGRGFISSNFRFARAGFSSAVANASIDFPLFRVRLDQFFYGQLFMSITRLKHQFIVFDISSQVQAGSI